MINKPTLSKCVGALCVLFCLACPAATSHAAFVAYICDDAVCAGGNDIIVTDNGAGDTFPGSTLEGQINAGVVSFAGFTIATNVAQSKPLIGSASQPQLDLTFSATTNDNLAHTIFFFASDTGFLSGGAMVLSLNGTQPAAGGANSVTGRAWGGGSNIDLDLANLLASFSSSNTPFALSSTTAFSPVANPFSLTIGVQITRAAAGTTTGDLHLSIPEPSSIVFSGLGLLGLVWLVRRRGHRTA